MLLLLFFGNDLTGSELLPSDFGIGTRLEQSEPEFLRESIGFINNKNSVLHEELKISVNESSASVLGIIQINENDLFIRFRRLDIFRAFIHDGFGFGNKEILLEIVINSKVTHMDLLESIDISIITVIDSFSISQISISISLKLDNFSGFILKGKNEFLSVGGNINISILIYFSELNILGCIFLEFFSLILSKDSLDLFIIFGKVLKFSNKLLRTFETSIVLSDIIFD